MVFSRVLTMNIFSCKGFFFLVISKFNRSILKISGFFGSQNKTIPSNCTQTHSEDMVIGFLCSCVIHSQSNFKAPAAAIDSWGHLYSLLASVHFHSPPSFFPLSLHPFTSFHLVSMLGHRVSAKHPYLIQRYLLKLFSTIYSMYLNRILLHLPGIFKNLNAFKVSWLFSN